MKRYFVDYYEIPPKNKIWNKKWETLSLRWDNSLNCKCADEDVNKFIDSIEAPCIVVIHWSCTNIKHLVKSLSKNPTVFVMIVSVGGINQDDMLKLSLNTKNVHGTTVPFYNNSDLTHLTQSFDRLCQSLKNSSTANDLVLAWKEFDKSAISELVELLSPLALINDNSVLADEIARSIFAIFDKNKLELATRELNDDDGQNALKCILLNTQQSTGSELYNWIRKHFGTLRELAWGCL